MGLSNDLLSQFVKITKTDTQSKKETTTYGTVVVRDGDTYVQLDGAAETELTPVTTTTNVSGGERVTVMIKNHSAVITGNTSKPAARLVDVSGAVSEFDIVLANKADVTELTAANGKIANLEADKADVSELNAANGKIANLEADYAEINEKLVTDEADITDLKAKTAEIETLKTDKLDASVANAKFATIESLEATNANIGKLDATYAKITELDSVKADIQDLDADKLSATDADLKYANIDFSNIDKAAMEYFYSQSGLIENVTVGDATITGTLVGVTITGDLIEGNTIVADKLVIKGDDGLYYKLNTDGVTTEAEQTEYNSLNGSVILTQSITASKISVDDLVAFDATIGGFNITKNAIYSGVKETAGNTTRGIYFDKDGQFSVGDSDNYIKYYKDGDEYKLDISALAGITAQLGDASKTATNYLNASGSGLVIGDHTGSYLGNNVLIDSDSVDVRNNETVLASFGADRIDLGKTSAEAVIGFCGGNATMTVTKDTSTGYYDGIRMDAQNFRVYGENTFMLSEMEGSEDNYNRFSLSTMSSDNSLSTALESLMKYEGKQYNSHIGTYSAADSDSQATYVNMIAEHYRGSGGGWQENRLRVEPTQTTLSDMNNSGLIRPWNKELWDGGFQMTESQTATLSEAITAQPTGVVLVFREIGDGVLKNSGLHTYFVPKMAVSEGPGWGHSISWAHHNGNYYVCKYLYISDTTIKGNALNDDTETTMSPSTIVTTNNRVALWKVYGV